MDMCSPLIVYSEELRTSASTTAAAIKPAIVGGADSHREKLRFKASKFRRNRLKFFNSAEGFALRLCVPSHPIEIIVPT